jgi:hypothetical protein
MCSPCYALILYPLIRTLYVFGSSIQTSYLVGNLICFKAKRELLCQYCCDKTGMSVEQFIFIIIVQLFPIMYSDPWKYRK